MIAERRAAELTDTHADTRTTVHLDSQGRAFLTVEHAGFTGGPPAPLLYETRLVLDVVGNVLSVEDARGNTAETRVFGMLQQVLRTDSEDAGWRLGLTDIAGAVVRSWNERGFASRVQYDALRRPTHHFVTPPAASETVVTRTIWGESLPSPATTNHRGQPYRIYDGAGELTHVAYDFKGNLLSQQRRLALAYETTQDWSLLDAATPPTPANIATLADSELDAEVFTTAFAYDALNRVTSSTTPDDSETLSTYNEAGLLETVSVRIRGAATPTTFVSDFDYDAKGQRLRCIHGNGTVTSYEYDPRTFRLARLRLIRDADSAVLQDLRYTYDPVGNITQIRDGAQQTVFFDNAVVSPDQRFEYDPLYRLTHAEGREHTSLTQPTHADLSFGPHPHPNDPSALRTYEEDYAWDEVGNLLQLQHAASGGNFTRQYVYATAGNRLLSNSAPGESTAPFSHSYTYDAHGNMTSMPHLAAMAWDHADRLQHCDLGGGGDVWFVYDAAGNRVRKVQVNTSGSTVRERVYVGAWEVWRERTGTPLAIEQERQTLHVGDDRGKLALVETLTVDDGDPVATPTSIQRHQHGNHLGSASLELDEDAAVISYEEFHPFGTSSYVANDSGIEVSAKRYRYIGKERDEETGLYHLGARYYASWLGRWAAADPIGLGDGINRFAYCRGNPVRHVDPTGSVGEDVNVLTGRGTVGKVLVRDEAGSGYEIQKDTATPARAALAEGQRRNAQRAKRIEKTLTTPVFHNLSARGTGENTGRRTNNTDERGDLIRGPSASSKRDVRESIVPVVGPAGDAAANFRDLGEAQSAGEAVGYGVLGLVNAAFAVADVVSLGTAAAGRAAFREAGIEVFYTGGKEASKNVGRVAAEKTLAAGDTSSALSPSSALQGDLLRAQLRLESTLSMTGRITAETPLELGTLPRLGVCDARSGRLVVGREIVEDSMRGGHQGLVQRFAIKSDDGDLLGGIIRITPAGGVVFDVFGKSGTYPSGRFTGRVDEIRGLGISVRETP